MASSSSASASCLTLQCKYEVFLSFRGEDTRENFTSHLYAALSRKKIRAFIDEEIIRGNEISPALLDAIEGSKISVIIFSKNYASSKWCLNELVKILECKNIHGQIVIPVFYHIQPSDVRKQAGSFREAFIEPVTNFNEMPEVVEKWREVLTKASNLSGYDSMNIRPEAKLVDVIVNDILKKLEHASVSSDSKGLIGVNSQIEHIKSLLGIGILDIRIVGIWGMGGVGKTTIAEALFHQISNKFEGKCFMANVREESEKGVGLVHLKNQIFSQLLEENFEIRGPNITQFTNERFQRTKVVIVLDDVNKFQHLEYLARDLDHFGPGSRIIVTTRDKQILEKCGVEYIYEVNGLKYHEALELFCNYAFRQNHCPEDLMVLAKSVLAYANGNPLALKVLGSYLYRKTKLNWENALKNLKLISDPDIYDVLKISYHELNLEEKSIFLDIACFFKGEDRSFMTRIFDDLNFVDYGLSVLVDKSLITISDNKLQMHDILQEMGREIVRQESVREPGKRSRLWHYEDVCSVLERKKGTKAIEGILLDLSKVEDINLNPRVFANMSNLRFLIFYMPEHIWHMTSIVMSTKVHLPEGLEDLPDELRYLSWHGYPLRTLPTNFNPYNLIAVCLPYSKVQQLWGGKKKALKLKSIELHYSQYLTRIPDRSEIPNLERINLSNCTSLPSVPLDIQNFNNLNILCLDSCESLKGFPPNIHFSSPITIDLSYCVNLKEFPEISGNIIKLQLRGTPIKEVPSSVQSLTKLKLLDLSGCTMLQSVSTSICKLESLLQLYLGYCSNLQSFPEISEKMKCLEVINLRSTAIKELPSSIENLEGLTTLWLNKCYKLDSLPENMWNLKSLNYLDAEESHISQLPSSITDLNKIKELSFSGCKGLVLPPLAGLSFVRKLNFSYCYMVEIPQDIGCLSSLTSLNLRKNNIDSLPTSINQLSRLRILVLSGCHKLQSLPELPLRLELLDASGCSQLQSLPELQSCQGELDASILEKLSKRSYGYKQDVINFDFTSCRRLFYEKAHGNFILADSRSRIQHLVIASLRLFYEKKYCRGHRISICLPGNKIPDWFSNQRSGSSITIQLPQHCCNRNFIGFALCAVIEYSYGSAVECRYRFETKTNSGTKNVGSVCRLVDELTFYSHHVVLGFNPCWNVRLPEGGHCTSVSIKFCPTETWQGCHKVRSCGVCPVYVHPNTTQPNTFSLKFGDTKEAECIEIKKIHNDFHDKRWTIGTTGSIRKSDEEEVEPSCKRIFREQRNSP